MTASPAQETAAVERVARQRWLAVLAHAGAAELAGLAAQQPLPEYQWLRRPEVGMLMLRGRVGGSGAPFNLAEVTVTRCTLRSADGHIGSGQVLGRDRQHATWIARLDAALQESARREALLQAVVEPLARQQAARRDEALRDAAASRVEFFTLVRGA